MTEQTMVMDVRVRARRDEAVGICSFELEALDGQALPAFSAGAHIDVHVPAGLVRQYSLCGDPQDASHWRIGVLRDATSRGGSAGMHEGVQVGSVLQVSRPRNLFGLAEAPHSVLVAGGIGVTPILAMARALHRQGASFELHYCARCPERMAFRDEIAGAGFAQQARFYFSEGSGDAPAFDAAAVAANAPAGAHLYVCGPAGFMDHVLGAARSAGWTESRLHREHFAAAAAPDGAGEQPFVIRLARSGAQLQVPAGTTALQVLLDHGIDVNFSCESGVCGSCITPVLDGVPEHRDSCLMDAEHAENKLFTPCCSRAKTPALVLDL
ncbi:PDR/VanB family oxidoreductase [Xenophilus arseniciresistens]|uniref:PDR/VanB family oxidoreductase n=1 Tax=Xenophilus arseniciresistens TaxID=1283306 RepID=A0AAE3T1B7_9BURK|nr:PDR/VanB family oxidoreductase [Xenophilus arseniciresistens]MDA7418400.1 PDR/VanB family oxidoreductase [Xenophilus arseniciresistens]